MGREIKRVPLDFDWPIGKTWGGFLHNADPRYPKRAPRKCPDCDGSGHNRHTKQIADEFYSFGDRARAWHDKITQDEADALVKAGRLHDLTSRFVPGDGWVKIDPAPRVLAADVNAMQRRGGLGGHDGINRWILVEARARRLGVYGNCRRCKGDGSIFRRRGDRKRWERWQQTPVPKGEGWQFWETVSEGSPLSPVFRTDVELAQWLVRCEGYTPAGAAAFVKSGWAPSAMMMGGKVYDGVEGLVPGDDNDMASKERRERRMPEVFA